MTLNDDFVLQILQEHGLVQPEQVDKAAMSVKQEGETVVDVLIQMKAVGEEEVLSLVAAQFGMELVHIDPSSIAPEMKDVIDGEKARKQIKDEKECRELARDSYTLLGSEYTDQKYITAFQVSYEKCMEVRGSKP